MDDHAAGGGELLVADMTLEVLRFLMLHQNLLVVEFPVAVVAEHLVVLPLLLLPHSQNRINSQNKLDLQTLTLDIIPDLDIHEFNRPAAGMAQM